MFSPGTSLKEMLHPLEERVERMTVADKRAAAGLVVAALREGRPAPGLSTGTVNLRNYRLGDAAVSAIRVEQRGTFRTEVRLPAGS